MRYSLRSLALLVTLISVALGIWTNRAFDQRQMTTKIRALGGDVEYAPASTPLIEMWLGKDFTSTVVSVQMYRSEPEDLRFHYVVSETEFIECVRQLPKLKRIIGLKSSHEGLAGRLRQSLPHVDVLLVYGGVI